MNLRDRFVAAVDDAQSDREERAHLAERTRIETSHARSLRELSKQGRHDLVGRLRPHIENIEKLNDEIADLLQRQRERLSSGFLGEMAHDAASAARSAVVIRVPGEQLAAFAGAPIDPAADHGTWLRSPFPKVFVAPHEPFKPTADWTYEPVRGVVVYELDHAAVRARALSRGEHEEWMAADCSWSLVERCIFVAYHAPFAHWPSLVVPTLLSIQHDGTLWLPPPESREYARACWAAHLLYYLTSPAVKLVQQQPDAKLVRAAMKRGKPAPSGWYEIGYHQTHVAGGPVSEKDASGRHVRYRFDVRGHFCTFRVGKLAGRTIWRRPHQRGIRNSLYVPKGYRVTSEATAS